MIIKIVGPDCWHASRLRSSPGTSGPKQVLGEQGCHPLLPPQGAHLHAGSEWEPGEGGVGAGIFF